MVHDNIVERLKTVLKKAQESKAADLVSQDNIDRSLAVELSNIRSEITRDDVIGVNPEGYRTPVTVSTDMELEGIKWPDIDRVASGQIDSSSTDDVVLLTGITNKILDIQAILMYKVAGTTQTWRIELDTGSSFDTTRRISETDANDKETQGQKYNLRVTDRIVSNVTGAVAASTIDWVIFYKERGFGTVWQV